jgi:hypothetical protein
VPLTAGGIWDRWKKRRDWRNAPLLLDDNYRAEHLRRRGSRQNAGAADGRAVRALAQWRGR